MEYREMNRDALEARLSALRAEYEAFQQMHLSLNMARGKPGKAQLELSDGLFTALQAGDAMQGEDKMDIRNYGVLTGIGELRQIFADLLGVKKENVILGKLLPSGTGMRCYSDVKINPAIPVISEEDYALGKIDEN